LAGQEDGQFLATFIFYQEKFIRQFSFFMEHHGQTHARMLD
jgi:hypothetical protein